MIADVKQRVTSIRDLLGRKADFSELKNAMRKGFAKALKANLEEGRLTSEESQKAEQLASKKYATDKWNLSR